MKKDPLDKIDKYLAMLAGALFFILALCLTGSAILLFTFIFAKS